MSEKCFVVFYVFSFPPVVYVGALNLISSIPGRVAGGLLVCNVSCSCDFEMLFETLLPILTPHSPTLKSLLPVDWQ